ncbi:MAG: hypothetical protein ABIQ31_06235 [Ferruginibacter sp.]
MGYFSNVVIDFVLKAHIPVSMISVAEDTDHASRGSYPYEPLAAATILNVSIYFNKYTFGQIVL